MSLVEPETRPVPATQPPECHLCRREAPCECMTFVQDGGPHTNLFDGTAGWSWHPERCMCTCGRCQA